MSSDAVERLVRIDVPDNDEDGPVGSIVVIVEVAEIVTAVRDRVQV